MNGFRGFFFFLFLCCFSHAHGCPSAAYSTFLCGSFPGDQEIIDKWVNELRSAPLSEPPLPPLPTVGQKAAQVWSLAAVRNAARINIDLETADEVTQVQPYVVNFLSAISSALDRPFSVVDHHGLHLIGTPLKPGAVLAPRDSVAPLTVSEVLVTFELKRHNKIIAKASI